MSNFYTAISSSAKIFADKESQSSKIEIKPSFFFENSPIRSVKILLVKHPQTFVQPRMTMPDHVQIALENVVVGHVNPDRGRIKMVSALVIYSTNRWGECPGGPRRLSNRSRDSNSEARFELQATCVVAKPVLDTPSPTTYAPRKTFRRSASSGAQGKTLRQADSSLSSYAGSGGQTP